MKYLKLFESVNLKSLEWYNNKIITDLKSLIKIKEIRQSDFEKRDYKDIYRLFITYNLENLSEVDNKKKEKIINNILNKWKNHLVKQNIILSFKIKFNHFNPKNEVYVIYIYYKEIYKNIIKPRKFVYHTSFKFNRDSILEHGLIPMPHSKSDEWKDNISLEYPPAIFAINDASIWDYGNNIETWQIDTSIINNKWYKDLNIQRKSEIMTFEPIPVSALKLVNTNQII